MPDFVIPCDTFVRLSNILHSFLEGADEFFRAIRIDCGQAVTTNRSVMVIENIGGPDGVIHIIADPQLIEACRKEAPFASKLTITANPLLRYAVAKTTLGYIHPTNCAVWSDNDTPFNNWRSIVAKCAKPATASVGGMFWNTDDVARVASASPSGNIVFETNITADGSRPTLIRDVQEPDWLGVINPHCMKHTYNPAKLPDWIK